MTDISTDAKREFGTTNNFFEAGWILADGSMLDFSGGERGWRTMDHGEICRILPRTEGRWDCFKTFICDANAIRYHFSRGVGEVDADIITCQEPTDKQIRRLQQALTVARRDEGRAAFNFDVTWEDGTICEGDRVEDAFPRDIQRLVTAVRKCKVRARVRRE